MKIITFTEIPLHKRPTANVWQVLTEQASRGQAILLQDSDTYAVQFSDETEFIPFDQLGYHKELSLYDKRRFPNL